MIKPFILLYKTSLDGVKLLIFCTKVLIWTLKDNLSRWALAFCLAMTLPCRGTTGNMYRSTDLVTCLVFHNGAMTVLVVFVMAS